MSESPDFSDDSNTRKRKRSAEPATKKKKRPKRSKPNDTYGDLDEVNGLNLSFSRLDPNLLADHIAIKQKNFGSDATTLELEERRIPDTTEWSEPRTLDKLPAFLKHFSATDLRRSPKEYGSPHTLVIAGAGLRAANLTRALREFQTKDAKVAKLFAKHIKLSESVEMLQTSRISIGVGTPTRLVALLDNGALKTSKLKRLVVDVSHIDQKKRGILDMKETFDPLLALLNRGELKTHFTKDKSGMSLLLH